VILNVFKTGSSSVSFWPVF